MSQAVFDLYSWNTPNGQKIVIALEEVGVPYTLIPVDITAREQDQPEFRALSPDGKIPVLVDKRHQHLSLFESGAILLYLANEYPVLHGQTDDSRVRVMSWTFWQVGQLGPLIGQYGRFRATQQRNDQAIDHFLQLIWRCLDVMERQLTREQYLSGNHFTVADIASFPWIASKQSYLQRYDITWRSRYPAIDHWAERVSQRSSVKKALDL